MIRRSSLFVMLLALILATLAGQPFAEETPTPAKKSLMWLGSDANGSGPNAVPVAH